MYGIRFTRMKTLAQSLVIRGYGRSRTLNVECNSKHCTCNLNHQAILKSRCTQSSFFIAMKLLFTPKVMNRWGRTSISKRSVGKTSPPNPVQWKEHINVHQSVQTI